MEKLIIKFLEFDKQLESDHPTQLDFDLLKKNLDDLREKAPELLRIVHDEKILRSYLMLQVVAKLRTLSVIENTKNAVDESVQSREIAAKSAQSLIEYYNHLKAKLNRRLSTRPRFRVEPQTKSNSGKINEFKM